MLIFTIKKNKLLFPYNVSLLEVIESGLDLMRNSKRLIYFFFFVASEWKFFCAKFLVLNELMLITRMKLERKRNNATSCDFTRT